MLEWSGGVLDALSLAVRGALSATLIPQLTVSGEGEEMEIEVSDNPHDSTKIDVSKAPIIVTLAQVSYSSLRMVCTDNSWTLWFHSLFVHYLGNCTTVQQRISEVVWDQQCPRWPMVKLIELSPRSRQ